MADVTIKRDGVWAVELIRPLHHAGRVVDRIDIKPLRFDHNLRWSTGRITSFLALLSELTDLPEGLLRQLTYPDIDTILLAFLNILPPNMQAVFRQTGFDLFATPPEELPEAETMEQQIVDQDDPRFPQSEGPVKRFSRPPVVHVPTEKTKAEVEKESMGNLDLEAPGDIRAVS